MARTKTAKNLIGSRDTYNRYFGDFRGIDFSSDHTQIDDRRLAYAVNMWKDYASGQGKALETIPGFRRRMKAPYGGRIHAIHDFKYVTPSPKLEAEYALSDPVTEHKVSLDLGALSADTVWIENVSAGGEQVIGFAPTSFSDTKNAVLTVRVQGLAAGTILDIAFEYRDAEENIKASSLQAALPQATVYEYAVQLNDDVFEFVGTDKDASAEFDNAQKTLALRASADLGRSITVFYRESDYTHRHEVIVHSGNRLILWPRFPDDADTEKNIVVTVPAQSGDVGGIPKFEIKMPEYVYAIASVYTESGGEITVCAEITADDTVTITSTVISEGDRVYIYYYSNVTTTQSDIFFGMNEAKSTSFTVDNKLYIIDGKNYIVYDGERCMKAQDLAYVPTTYINTIPEGENADIGVEFEQRNMLSDKFKQTFIADGSTKKFFLNENALEDIISVKVYGKELIPGSEYTSNLASGMVEISNAPTAPESTLRDTADFVDTYYPEGYAGIEITAKKSVRGIAGTERNGAETIKRCTIAETFDGRVFLSGNPDAPNTIFYCERRADGHIDPTYFGVLDYMQDGVSFSRITAMIAVADSLAVLKEKSSRDGTVFYHTPTETGVSVQPKIYPSVQGLAGVGCLGAAVNFLDDPIFISSAGVEAIGQLSVRYERAIEHRSSLIDAKLAGSDLSDAILEEWNGYLAMLVDGKIFLADSRQVFTHETGVPQYEWYFLEDIGIFEDQYTEYRYSEKLSPGLEGRKVKYCTKCARGASGCTCESDENFIEIPLLSAQNVYYADTDTTADLRGTVANPPDAQGKATQQVFSEIFDFNDDGFSYPVGIYYTVHEVRDRVTLEFLRHEAYVCETRGAMTGGVYHPAVTLKNIDGVLHFGTDNGHVCAFNTDKRSTEGQIPTAFYTFDGRAIYSGCATKMDNCGIPHLTKSTVKKSTVIKTKSLASSAAKIRVRTNKKPYEQISRISSKLFSFDDMDFSDFSFSTSEQNLFSIKEKERKWVEKQYFIYSDEYMKPFALYYVCYRYVVAGRYKE